MGAPNRPPGGVETLCTWVHVVPFQVQVSSGSPLPFVSKSSYQGLLSGGRVSMASTRSSRAFTRSLRSLSDTSRRCNAREVAAGETLQTAQDLRLHVAHPLEKPGLNLIEAPVQVSLKLIETPVHFFVCHWLPLLWRGSSPLNIIAPQRYLKHHSSRRD